MLHAHTGTYRDCDASHRTNRPHRKCYRKKEGARHPQRVGLADNPLVQHGVGRAPRKWPINPLQSHRLRLSTIPDSRRPCPRRSPTLLTHEMTRTEQTQECMAPVHISLAHVPRNRSEEHTSELQSHSFI